MTILEKLAATLVDFDPRFEVMPGTKAHGGQVAHAEGYEAVPGKTDRGMTAGQGNGASARARNPADDAAKAKGP